MHEVRVDCCCSQGGTEDGGGGNLEKAGPEGQYLGTGRSPLLCHESLDWKCRHTRVGLAPLLSRCARVLALFGDVADQDGCLMDAELKAIHAHVVVAGIQPEAEEADDVVEDADSEGVAPAPDQQILAGQAQRVSTTVAMVTEKRGSDVNLASQCDGFPGRSWKRVLNRTLYASGSEGTR